MTTTKQRVDLLATLDHYRSEAATIIAQRIRDGAHVELKDDGTALVYINTRPIVLDTTMLSAVQAIYKEIP